MTADDRPAPCLWTVAFLCGSVLELDWRQGNLDPGDMLHCSVQDSSATRLFSVAEAKSWKGEVRGSVDNRIGKGLGRMIVAAQRRDTRSLDIDLIDVGARNDISASEAYASVVIVDDSCEETAVAYGSYIASVAEIVLDVVDACMAWDDRRESSPDRIATCLVMTCAV